MSYIVWKVKQVNIKPLGSWLRWQGRGTQNSLPSASTSKTHLHVGPFSLKRNWRLAERLLNTQGFKQGPWVVREEGRKTHQVGIYGPGRGIRGKGRSPGQRPALGSQQFQPSMGYPSPGILHREAESPGWLGGGWDDEGVWGNLEWHLGGAEAAQGTQQGSLEPDGSQPTPPTHAKSPRGPSCSTAGRGRRGLESGLGGGQWPALRDKGDLDLRLCPGQLLAPDRQCGGDSPNLCLQRIRAKAPLASSPPPAPTLGGASQCWDRESTRLRGTGSAQSRPYGLLLQQLGTDSAPAEQGWLLNRGETPPHTGSSSSPSVCSPTSYQDDSGQHILRKDVTGVHIKSSPPAKTQGTRSLRRNVPV